MITITQTGKNAQATGWNKSPIINKNKISITLKQKANWFVSGIILPIIVSFIIEYINEWKISELINYILR